MPGSVGPMITDRGFAWVCDTMGMPEEESKNKGITPLSKKHLHFPETRSCTFSTKVRRISVFFTPL